MKENIKKISFFEGGVLFLGVFCILAGLGLIIASNWEMIPAALKLLGSLGLLIVGLFGIYCFREKQQRLGIEISLFYSFLMIGANIALIQQTYHLSIGFSQGALLWAILSTPFLFLTKRLLLPIVWMVLFVCGIYDYLIDLYRFLEKYFDFLGYRGVAGLFFIGFLLTYFSSASWAKKGRNACIFFAGLVMLFGDTFLGLPFFNQPMGDIEAMSPIGVLLTITLLAPVVFSVDTIAPQKYFFGILTYVALQVVLLFWTARFALAQTGIALAVFGALLLLIAAAHAKFVTLRE